MSVLTPKTRNYLLERRYGVLATISPDGTPHQSVVWYVLEDDTVLMSTVSGRIKERNLRRDPRASICIEDGNCYVTLSGIVSIDEDEAQAQADILKLAVRYQGHEKAERRAFYTFRKQRRITIRMKIEHITTLWGRRSANLVPAEGGAHANWAPD